MRCRTDEYTNSAGEQEQHNERKQTQESSRSSGLKQISTRLQSGVWCGEDHSGFGGFSDTVW